MTSKQVLLVILIQLASLISLGQKPTCKSLHIGSFKVFTKETGTTYIKRSPTEQIETNDNLGYKVIFSITWIDQCTYELRPKKLIQGDPSIMGDGSSFVRTRIKDITPKGYVAETTASFGNETFDFTVEIVH